MSSMDEVEQLAYMPFDPVIKRTEGTLRCKASGKIFKVTKGAPHILLKLLEEQHADPAIITACERDIISLGNRDIRCLAVAKSEDEQGQQWELLGLVTFLDPPRPDTKRTIEEARRYGIAVKMITGDHVLIARETARVLEIGSNILSASGLPLLDPVTKDKPANLGRDYGEHCLQADGFAQGTCRRAAAETFYIIFITQSINQ